MSETISGTCLCGLVTVTISKDAQDLGACHCKYCQKWAGGPFFELECGTQVEFTGEEHVKTFKSSAWAERGFCSECGSHLFIRDVRSGEYGISPGLFSGDNGFEFRRQVFIDHKPSYYSFSNETTNITSEFIYEHYPETRETKTDDD